MFGCLCMSDFNSDYKAAIMETFWQDLRQGVRSLLKQPTFTFIAVIALALGIGANTAIFSVINAVLLQSLPYRDSDRLVIVWEHNLPRNREFNVVNPANFMDWKEQNKVFEDMAAFVDDPAVLTGDGEPEEVPAQVTTPNLFSVLGVNAIVGRTFTTDDWKPRQTRSVVISYALWQRRYGGDPNIAGRKIIRNQSEAVIVGVLPADFKWFIKKGSLSGKNAELWAAYALTNELRVRRGRFLSVVGRLNPGVSVEQAQSEMSAIAGQLERQYYDFNAGWGVNVVPLRQQLTGEISLALWVLLGSVGFLLLIACANVANLLLAKATAREREIAIRTALGAGRWRIVRQLLTESLLLSLIGGAAGLIMAWWGIDALSSLAPRELLEMPKIRINGIVLGFTALVCLLTTIAFGLIPALEASRRDSYDLLKEGSKNIAGGNRRLRDAFVIAEIAIALVLLVGAGLLIKSFIKLQSVDPGFNSQNVMTMRVSLPGRRYEQERQVIQFFKQAIERIKSLPGVRDAGAISFLPFAAPSAGTGFEIEGRPKQPSGQEYITRVEVTDENYFRTMQIPLRRGRFFTEQESTDARHVVIINEALAKKYFANEEPLGKRLTIHMKDEEQPTEIIGVVADSKQMTLEGEVEPMIYWPHPELAYNGMTIVIRTGNDPRSVTASATDVIKQMDAQQPIADIRTMDEVVGKTVARSRFNTLLLSIFAVVAMLLAAVGIYGVMAYSVTQRTREIGIRVALGAQAGDILKMVVGRGMLLVAIGSGVGLATAFALTRVMASLLFEISATDPLTFAAVVGLLLFVALMACLLPARRAANVDPMIALRYE